MLICNEDVDQFNAVEEEDTMMGHAQRLQTDSLVSKTKVGTIRYMNEYRFMCFRHWNLYESMFHSSYMASRLGIWRENGTKTLQHFLTKM